MSQQAAIREEELKNRVAAAFFGKYDCTRIVGNIDFCVLTKRRDPSQKTFISDTPMLWAEAKNHPTDVHRMLAQLILTIKGGQKGDVEPPRFVGCFDNEKIAFVEYHYILPGFNQNDFNWTQTPSTVDDKTVETVRGVIPAEKIVVFRIGSDDAEIKAFIARNFTSGESPALATPIDRNSATLLLCVKENITPAARAVLDAGRELWRYYHAQPNANPNASYYDIRLHFQGVKRTASGKEQMNATSSDETYNALLAKLRSAHKALADKIALKVYEYGFLK